MQLLFLEGLQCHMSGQEEGCVPLLFIPTYSWYIDLYQSPFVLGNIDKSNFLIKIAQASQEVFFPLNVVKQSAVSILCFQLETQLEIKWFRFFLKSH